MFRSLTALLLAGLLCGLAAPVPAEASVTLLIPSQPGIMTDDLHDIFSSHGKQVRHIHIRESV